MKKNNKVLIVEDQKIIAKVFSILIQKKGFEVTISSNPSDAILRTKELNPFLILMDVQLNDSLTGIDIARHLRLNGYNNKIVFTTGNLLENTTSQISDIDNCAILIKPVEFSEIERLL